MKKKQIHEHIRLLNLLRKAKDTAYSMKAYHFHYEILSELLECNITKLNALMEDKNI